MIKKFALSTLAAGVTVPAMLMLGTGHRAWSGCEYTAVPVGGGLKPLPAYKVPFHLHNGQESTLWFPASRLARRGMSRSHANTAA
jgi:hypothetical protein